MQVQKKKRQDRSKTIKGPWQIGSTWVQLFDYLYRTTGTVEVYGSPCS